jgi:hypothetical protein
MESDRCWCTSMMPGKLTLPVLWPFNDESLQRLSGLRIEHVSNGPG